MAEVNTYAQTDLRNRVTAQTNDAGRGWQASEEFETRVQKGEDPFNVSVDIQKKHGIDTKGFMPTVSATSLHQQSGDPYQLRPVGSDDTISMSEYSGGQPEPLQPSPAIGAVGSDSPVRHAIFRRG